MSTYPLVINGNTQTEIESFDSNHDKKIISLIAVSALTLSRPASSQVEQYPITPNDSKYSDKPDYIYTHFPGQVKLSDSQIKEISLNQAITQKQFFGSYTSQLQKATETLIGTSENIRVYVNSALTENIFINGISSSENAIIDNKEHVEGMDDNMLVDKLLEQRNRLEKNGFITGISLAGLSLILPLFFPIITYANTIPTSLMFLSLPGFVFIRKKLRGENDV